MNEKTPFIKCDCKSKLSYYPFLIPIIYMIIRYFQDLLFEVTEPKLSFRILRYNLPYLFYLYLPKVLSIFLIPIIKFNIRAETDSGEENILLRNYHFIAKNKNRKKFILLIYIISLLEVVCDNGDCLLYYYQRINYKESQEKKKLGWLIEKKSLYIIFVPILCFFIMDKNLYKHHILALILGIIGACFVNICRFTLDFSKVEDYPFHLLNSLFSLLLSLSLVITKYLMNKCLILSPYNFLFYDGIFCIFNSFIYSLVIYPLIINLPNYNKKLDEQKENDYYFSYNYLQIITIFIGQSLNFYIYFFLILILLFVYYIINSYTIYNFSPYLFILLEAFLPIDNDFIPIILNQNVDDEQKIIKRTIIQSIGYLILFFASLIMNEIIIFNFFGLNKNTFDIISSRGSLDSSNIKELDHCNSEICEGLENDNQNDNLIDNNFNKNENLINEN